MYSREQELAFHLTARWYFTPCCSEYKYRGWEIREGECRFGHPTCVHPDHSRRMEYRMTRSMTRAIEYELFLEDYFWFVRGVFSSKYSL